MCVLDFSDESPDDVEYDPEYCLRFMGQEPHNQVDYCPICRTPRDAFCTEFFFPCCTAQCEEEHYQAGKIMRSQRERNHARKLTQQRQRLASKHQGALDQQFNQEQADMKPHDQQFDSEMAAAIRKAAIHANEVCGREGVKATERHERVGIFCTSLRTHCGLRTDDSLRQWLVNNLCNKRIWYDIGELEAAFELQNFSPWKHDRISPINKDRLRQWVANSTIALSDTDEEFAEIDNDLALIRADLTELQHLNARGEAVATEANRVADEIDELMLQAAEL